MRRWIGIGTVLLVCGGLFWVLLKGFDMDPRAVPFMLKGKPAPDFTLKRMDTGEEVTLAQLRGRPLVINFWASWCSPCKYEHPVLEWGNRAYGRQALFLSVLFEDTEENAKDMLRKLGGGEMLQLVDPSSRMAVDYGVSGVPETYFVDANGTIRDKHVGPIDPDSLRKQVDALLKPLASNEATR